MIEDILEKELVPSEDIIQLGRDYSSLLAETDNLKGQINQSISQNPLLDVSDLQQKLKINQDNIKEIGEKLDKLRLLIDPDKTMSSSMDVVTKLSLLVAQRENLFIERDQWVNHSAFFNQKLDTTQLDSPLNQFKKCDAQILSIDKLIIELQNGKEVTQPDFLQSVQVEPTVFQTVKHELVSEQIKAETQLIMSQAPEASVNKWKQLGYELLSDAKPIHVYASVVTEGEIVKSKDVEFYLKPVYDVSQTTGSDKFQSFHLNENDKEQVSKVIYGLTDNVANKELVNQIPVNSIGLTFNEVMKNYIDLTVEQSLKTPSQGLQKQFEINAVSYVVANHLGLDSKEMYSLEGLKQFNTSPNSMKNLDSSLKIISKNSDKLVQSINQKVTGKSQQKNKFDERVANGKAVNKHIESTRPTQEQEQKQSLRR